MRINTYYCLPKDIRAKTTSKATDSTVIGSIVEVNCWRVTPALIKVSLLSLLESHIVFFYSSLLLMSLFFFTCMNTKEGGATPKNEPIQNGLKGTPK